MLWQFRPYKTHSYLLNKTLLLIFFKNTEGILKKVLKTT